MSLKACQHHSSPPTHIRRHTHTQIHTQVQTHTRTPSHTCTPTHIRHTNTHSDTDVETERVGVCHGVCVRVYVCVRRGRGGGRRQKRNKRTSSISALCRVFLSTKKEEAGLASSSWSISKNSLAAKYSGCCVVCVYAFVSMSQCSSDLWQWKRSCSWSAWVWVCACYGQHALKTCILWGLSPKECILWGLSPRYIYIQICVNAFTYICIHTYICKDT